jgi:predicted glycoside hydrolase/deacetylase ChbG (UPF0249 family)
VLIINADDWGRSVAETNLALDCFRKGRITSVTAMMFMVDSERAAELARQNSVNAGLHLNLNQPYTGRVSSAAMASQLRIAGFLNRSKFAVLLYHPGLRRLFRDVFQIQIEEFVRLYGALPTHVDGHQHKHLCENMLVDRIIPHGLKVRRSFSFFPQEKGLVNRAYRRYIDKRLAREHPLTDYFFSLSLCLQKHTLNRALFMARTSSVELMAHPINPLEYAYLDSDEHARMLSTVQIGGYAQI